MDIEIRHKYCGVDQYLAPVVVKSFPRDVFMKHVREGVQVVFSRSNDILKINRVYANVLEQYLEKYEVSDIVPDESFIEKIRLTLKEDGLINTRGKPYREMTRKKISRFARQVINEYFFPKGLVKRKLLIEVGRQKYERFLKLTKNSQEAIKWFEGNGKVVRALPVYVETGDKDDLSRNGESRIKRILKVADRKLLSVPNATKIQQALLLLKIINKRGFEFVEEDDVGKLEEYCDQRNLKKKQDYLADVATFFANIHDQGFIKSNPFAHVSLKKDAYSSVKNEFFSIEAIDKIKDISTVNRKDKLEVRDRLFALLGYDLAMRLGEILSLKVSDIQNDPDGELFVRLRPEIQKGTKHENVLYFFFDETKELLQYYIQHIRKKFTPQTDLLILAQHGTRLHPHRCRIAFQNLCEKFDLKTFYGKKPSPHCLRHSFATLNIEPLGLSLPLNGIMDRLRHTRSEIAERHYIHDNPYLKKLKHKVYKKRIKRETTSEILDGIPLPDLEYWLSDRLGLDSSITELIRRKHKVAFIKKESAVDKEPDDNKIYIAEDEALKRVKLLDIPVRSLRQYALDNGALRSETNGSIKYGKGFKYREEMIEELTGNWVLSTTVRKKLKLPTRTFYRLIKNEKWRTKQIGKNLYIHRQDY